MEYSPPTTFLTLQQAADIIGVSVDTLLRWNELNILKPTITPDGHVGYRPEQVNQFLAIRQPLMVPDQTVSPPQNTLTQASPVSNSRSEKPFSYAPVITVSALTITLAFILITKHSELRLLLQHADNVSAVLASQFSRFNYSGTTTSNIPIQFKSGSDNSGSSTTLDNLGELENKLASLSIMSSSKSAESVDITPADDFASLFPSYGQTVNFTDDNSIQDQLPDRTADSGVLSASLGLNSPASSGPVKQSVDLNLLLVLLIPGLFSLPLLFRNAPVSAKHLSDTHTGSQSPAGQILLELNQKTDGTVVITFRGQDYKISKPELDSESDRFIEKLMSRCPPGLKELDFDSSTDEDMKTDAPLSKLVTRLGFVGIKRELFFPRTSKTKVHFRKYLTRADFVHMGLTEEQISAELASAA